MTIVSSPPDRKIHGTSTWSLSSLQRHLETTKIGHASTYTLWKILHEAGPYQAIPQAGCSWCPQGNPKRHPHEYVRGGTAKLFTLFHPRTDGPIKGERLEFLQTKAAELSHLFQRSSSCVEGRNGVLSMMHHGFHGLSDQRLQALTVVHNFYIRRSDGTTAAERFFGQKHNDIFEELLKRVRIPHKSRAKWRHDRNGAKPKRLAA